MRQDLPVELPARVRRGRGKAAELWKCLRFGGLQLRAQEGTGCEVQRRVSSGDRLKTIKMVLYENYLTLNNPAQQEKTRLNYSILVIGFNEF